jgi:hypothetical protein
MKKSLLFVLPILLVFSLSAFAGEGSDTIGACKLAPEIRYSYFNTPTTFERGYQGFFGDNMTTEHSVTVGLTWGVADNLDLYGFAGARIGSILIGRTTIDMGGPLDRKVQFDPHEGFTCGLGVRGTFWRSPGGLYVGGGASVTYGEVTFRDLTGYGNNGHAVTVAFMRGYFKEQNLAAAADLHAGWNLKNIGLTPYLGVEYRWNKVYLESERYDNLVFTFREQEPVGVYVGLDYLIRDRLNLNLEGHMINRWGGSVTLDYRFDICGAPIVVPAAAPEPVIEPKLEPMSSK